MSISSLSAGTMILQSRQSKVRARSAMQIFKENLVGNPRGHHMQEARARKDILMEWRVALGQVYREKTRCIIPPSMHATCLTQQYQEPNRTGSHRRKPSHHLGSLQDMRVEERHVANVMGITRYMEKVRRRGTSKHQTETLIKNMTCQTLYL